MVTDSIVNAIEQGVSNWRMPWHTWVENQYEWILPVIERLLADEHWPADVLGGRHVRAIAATHAAASIHAGGYADLDLRATSMTRTVLR
jgi:hypothetical protein